MAKKKLTDISIKHLKPGDTPREVADGGASGLYVWIGTTGAKSFVVRYRFPKRDGKPKKLTLGRWVPPEGRGKEAEDLQVGDPLSLAAARELAGVAMRQVKRGIDPAAEKKRADQAKRQAAADTFEAIAIEYLKRECGMKLDAEGVASFDRSKKRSGADRYRTLKRQVFPTLGARPITEIKKSEIIRLLDQLADTAAKDKGRRATAGGEVAADRCLALIRRIFRWHAGRDDDFRSPLVAVENRVKQSEQARERTLTDAELRTIWKTASQLEGPFPAFLRFLLLTGARRSEASEMRWEEVKEGDWLLPASRNKTKRDLLRPLSKMAQELLQAQPRVGPYVFSSDGVSPISGYSKYKARFDAVVLKTQAEALENWTLHDLRRTARSLMSRAGISPDHAERCLGHVIGGVRGTYDRHEFYDEKKKAFEALASQIERIVNPLPENVVPLPRADSVDSPRP